MKKTAIKTAAMLSAAALLAMSGIAVSQAAEEVDAVQTETVAVAADSEAAAPEAATEDQETSDAAEGDAETAADSETADEAAGAEEAPPAAAAEEEPIPQDTPQVQKLMALYPRLIARIEPVGKVCFEGEECDVTVRASGGSADGEPRDGKAVYDAVCHTCHATGLLGSPALGDAGAWGPRAGKGKDTLYDHAINGFNAMPAKGGADIPDEEVQNAVDYMVSEST
ncbi:c-type cytochrome [Psychrobacter pygoscelis]|uniref:c-type cytochrome n=1 Tax=Psychrobacter pygoscelis TaxID=2488563 RepID=UPI001F61AC85|nr:c-type cytochrome [Psychrobacter pygoscelis]